MSRQNVKIAVLKSLALTLAVCAGPAIGLAQPATSADAVEAKAVEVSQPAQEEQVATIQLAILLDTSGSMDGLINQARTQLWKIVNELAAAEQQGKESHLEVALYEYGKQSLPAAEGYLRMIVPLSDDLDKLSEELFALQTNGGDEYCGWVIKSAVEGLKWSEDDDALKLIYICGNEPFTQGKVGHKESCQAAIEKGIIVNTIFCGDQQEGINTGWKEGATLADGSFMHIDQNRAVAQIETPFDKKLAELSGKVNGTYLFYGAAEDQAVAEKRQVAQDAKAEESAPGAAANRAAFKASGKYRGSARCLVTDIKSGKADLSKLSKDELPKEMQKMTPEERKAHIAKLQKQRDEITKQIQDLTAKRKSYIAEERKKTAEADGKDSLDTAVIKSIQTQAKKKNFKFNN